MFTHGLALLAAGVVATVIHYLFGDSLSLTVEFFLTLVLGGAVYVVAFYKLKTLTS